MSKATHSAAMQMTQLYAIEHPEIRGLVDLFIKMSEHPKAMCKIQIGTYNTETESFSPKLISNVRFANTLFSFYEGEPQIYIKNHSENVCLFNITAIGKMLYQKSYSIPKPLNYEKETYIFSYNNDDYKLDITFEITK